MKSTGFGFVSGSDSSFSSSIALIFLELEREPQQLS